MVSKEHLVELLTKGSFDVLISLGAGDIEDYVPMIELALREKFDV